jgi:hypothetical protein
MAKRISQAIDSSAIAASRKRLSPYNDQSEAGARKRQTPNHIYDNVFTNDSAEAHLGDNHLQHEYHAPVYHISDSTYFARSQLRTTRTRVEDVLESLRFKQIDDHHLTITVACVNTCQ